MLRRVVMLSGGVTSFVSLTRILDFHDPDTVTALFCDTLIEDEDTYRFLDEINKKIHPVTRIADGRDPWTLFRDNKFLANRRFDLCSRVLKRELADKWCRENAPDSIRVLGLDWSEPHRIANSRARFSKLGIDVEFPLDAPPHLFKFEYMATVRQYGIEPPRAYALGFEHNNCGFFCVKGGQAQFARLLQVMPDRYAYHEEQEEITRKVIGKDVSILTDRRGGKRIPMTLRDFRKRIEAGVPPMDDIFSCTCFEDTDSEPAPAGGEAK